MKILKSLQDFNSERYAALKQADKVQGNGIACERCGNEMVDGETNYGIVLPRVQISCPVCGNWEYRLA